jgi:hypothetical protein
MLAVEACRVTWCGHQLWWPHGHTVGAAAAHIARPVEGHPLVPVGASVGPRLFGRHPWVPAEKKVTVGTGSTLVGPGSPYKRGRMRHPGTSMRVPGTHGCGTQGLPCGTQGPTDRGSLQKKRSRWVPHGEESTEPKQVYGVC